MLRPRKLLSRKGYMANADAQNAIADDMVVAINYTLKSDGGEVLDSSTDADPLHYLHGHGQIIPGLENALVGKKVGEKFSVTIEPAFGYGDYDPSLVRPLTRDQFPKGSELNVGAAFHVTTTEGYPLMLRITEINGDDITVDANHPLSGKTLFFEVEVRNIRKATATELEHGHAHGPDGAEHE
jgi:FKBP-type peptidyl-prolyl cis-trans isomerase SlyD